MCFAFRGAHIDVRNKKGNTPLWLAANGGHYDVVQLLVQAGADVDAADNRKITPLMSAFRKVGHQLIGCFQNSASCLVLSLSAWVWKNQIQHGKIATLIKYLFQSHSYCASQRSSF